MQSPPVFFAVSGRIKAEHVEHGIFILRMEGQFLTGSVHSFIKERELFQLFHLLVQYLDPLQVSIAPFAQLFRRQRADQIDYR